MNKYNGNMNQSTSFKRNDINQPSTSNKSNQEVSTSNKSSYFPRAKQLKMSNSIDLMPVPKFGGKLNTNQQNNFVRPPKTIIPNKPPMFNAFVNNNNSNEVIESEDTNNSNRNVQKSNKIITKDTFNKNFYLEPVRFLTGNVEQVLKWHKMLNEYCHYEVIAPVIAIQDGQIPRQKKLLLKDTKGPVLKLIYYTQDRIDLPNFHLGQTIRCVGRMIDTSTLQAISIREATANEVSCLSRFYYICDQEIQKF